MKKLLSVIVVIAIALTLGTVSVSAATYDVAFTASEGVIAEVTDMHNLTEPATWDGNGAHEYEGNSLVITDAVNGNFGVLKVTGVEAGTYKVAFFYTIDAIKDSANPPSGVSGMQDWRTIIKANGTQMNLPYYDCTFDNIDFNGLVNVVGKKIIAVSVINVTEDGDLTIDGHVKGGYMTGSLDRIVLAGADYDFGPANYPDYEVFIEQAPHEGAAEKKGQDGDWTPSDLTPVEDGGDEGSGDEGTGDEGTGDEGSGDEGTAGGEDVGSGDEGTGEGSGSTDVPETGDVSAILAIVAAGAAAFGGLKLRKR